VNVLIVLIDDMDFGVPRPFGGPVHTPNVEMLASIG
jgi:arylsulfatase A-like enzyme